MADTPNASNQNQDINTDMDTSTDSNQNPNTNTDMDTSTDSNQNPNTNTDMDTSAAAGQESAAGEAGAEGTNEDAGIASQSTDDGIASQSTDAGSQQASDTPEIDTAEEFYKENPNVAVDLGSVAYANQYYNTNRVTTATDAIQGATQFADFDLVRPRLTKMMIARLTYGPDNKTAIPDYESAVDAYFNPQSISLTINNSALESGNGLGDPLTNVDTRSAQVTTLAVLRTLNFTLFFDSFGMHAGTVKGNRGAQSTQNGMTEANTLLSGEMQFKTGTLASYAESRYDVREDIEKLIAMATIRDKETHAQGKVLIEYGKLFYQGVLRNISVQYTKFTERAVCVRATVNVTFMGYEDIFNLNGLKPAESPDTSKFHTMIQGEKLTDVSSIAYDTPREWRPVARANNIANPRLVIPGDTLVMPAL